MDHPPRLEEEAHRGHSWIPISLEPLGERPLVSVLLTNYNYAPFIDDAIRSVVAQTYRRFELIAVDDGSTDGSAEILSRWNDLDPRIEVLYRPNRGVVVSTNEAFDRSAGEIICLLDSDDVFLPKKLETLVASFRRLPVGYVHHIMRKVGADGALGATMPRFGSLDRGFLAPDAWRQGGRWRRAVSSGIALRREVADKVMPIPEGSTTSQDGYVCMLVPFVTSVGAIDSTLALYRVHRENLAGRSDLDAARFRMQHVVDNVASVNMQLESLGIGPPIELDRNLAYREQTLLSHALGTTSHLETARQFVGFARRLGRDPIFTWREKLALAFLYGVMTALPAHRRSGWLRAVRQAAL